MYFGGKSRIAPIIWQALGDPRTFIEPFFGSGAVLLNRPRASGHRLEIVNDIDGLLANVWRALQYDPDTVARWCDWPCNHADLMSRKSVLVAAKDNLQKLVENDGYYDAKLAGYWLWCASNWIGSGLTRPTAIPGLTCDQGVNSKRPHLTCDQGVNAQIPNLTHDKGVKDVRDPYHDGLYVWFRQLSERLRDVKVVCGDWTRVCGGNWQDGKGDVGIYLDPPYSHLANRDNDLYDHEDSNVALDVAKWAEERGRKPSYRIVLSGYFEEHKWLLGKGWNAHRYKENASYKAKSTNKNRFQETLFLSPYCNQIVMPLFGEEME